MNTDRTRNNQAQTESRKNVCIICLNQNKCAVKVSSKGFIYININNKYSLRDVPTEPGQMKRPSLCIRLDQKGFH